MASRLHEDECEMERRHIREATARIARQEEVVVKLDLMGSEELALNAREPLIRFHKFIEIARDRLAYLERKRDGNTPESN